MHFIYIWYNVIHIENQKFFHRKPSIYAVYISYPQFVDNLCINVYKPYFFRSITIFPLLTITSSIFTLSVKTPI